MSELIPQSGPGGDQDPLVIPSGIHGEDDVAEWQPTAPPRVPASKWRTVMEEAPQPGFGLSPAPPELAAPASSRRAFSLDALRGFFLVTMTMGFTVGADKFWPLWMFHRQEPWGAETPLDVAAIVNRKGSSRSAS
jgi:hypothetical protein